MRTTASETCSFNWTALFNSSRFCLPILPSLLLILLKSEAVVRWCSTKKVFQILQWSCRSTEFNFVKKEIPAQMFFCKFWEISHKTFFKEPFGRLLLHEHSFCLLSQHDLNLFKNDFTHISWESISRLNL